LLGTLALHLTNAWINYRTKLANSLTAFFSFSYRHHHLKHTPSFGLSLGLVLGLVLSFDLLLGLSLCFGLVLSK
jgi:hypothetical protein